ncbi:hypothetical protein TCON_0945 [Astathelohania contejeani]|uniref:Uncharacterized protein n=1 Tax=Astathelohania contejeani TaxID=164912 RepID=A0ABQ7I0B7_9MICR|nr:hypothetical protein TCON_0945 [Thelohania contejeani]
MKRSKKSNPSNDITNDDQKSFNQSIWCNAEFMNNKDTLKHNVPEKKYMKDQKLYQTISDRVFDMTSDDLSFQYNNVLNYDNYYKIPNFNDDIFNMPNLTDLLNTESVPKSSLGFDNSGNQFISKLNSNAFKLKKPNMKNKNVSNTNFEYGQITPDKTNLKSQFDTISYSNENIIVAPHKNTNHISSQFLRNYTPHFKRSYQSTTASNFVIPPQSNKPVKINPVLENSLCYSKQSYLTNKPKPSNRHRSQIKFKNQQIYRLDETLVSMLKHNYGYVSFSVPTLFKEFIDKISIKTFVNFLKTFNSFYGISMPSYIEECQDQFFKSIDRGGFLNIDKYIIKEFNILNNNLYKGIGSKVDELRREVLNDYILRVLPFEQFILGNKIIYIYCKKGDEIYYKRYHSLAIKKNKIILNRSLTQNEICMQICHGSIKNTVWLINLIKKKLVRKEIIACLGDVYLDMCKKEPHHRYKLLDETQFNLLKKQILEMITDFYDRFDMLSPEYQPDIKAQILNTRSLYLISFRQLKNIIHEVINDTNDNVIKIHIRTVIILIEKNIFIFRNDETFKKVIIKYFLKHIKKMPEQLTDSIFRLIFKLKLSKNIKRKFINLARNWIDEKLVKMENYLKEKAGGDDCAYLVMFVSEIKVYKNRLVNIMFLIIKRAIKNRKIDINMLDCFRWLCFNVYSHSELNNERLELLIKGSKIHMLGDVINDII